MRYIVISAAITLALTASVAHAQPCSQENWKPCLKKAWVIGKSMETPIGERWWPHKRWGPTDEAGATNWYLQPAVVARAFAEVKTGKAYSLGHPYSGNMPAFGQRKFVLRISGAPSGGPLGANNLVYHDDFVSTEIGQIGTHLDGLGHIGVAVRGHGDKNEMRFYNGFTETEIGRADGLTRLGVEKLHPITARGILLDIAGLKEGKAMEAGQEITLADVKAALERQGMKDFKFEPGDCIFFRTGWSRHWIKDNARYNNGEPGIGMEVAKWLSDEVEAGVVGADTWGVEVDPNPEKECKFCIHSHLLTRHGILIQENMNLDALAHHRVYTFLFIQNPVPVVGATGSIGAPLAIK